MAAEASKPLVECLDVDNYATWRILMKYVLISKGLWAAVESDTVEHEDDQKALATIGLYLRMQLSQLKMGATEPLTKYVSRAKEIQAQLRAAGQDVADTEIAWSVMSGLPSAYATMATVITATTDGDLMLDGGPPGCTSARQLSSLLTYSTHRVMGPNPRCTN
ncbi:hypothetical protein CHLNCDRAFT_142681 [Chlorella variabilis]|uniref:DUF4219 domain-containing protein n=1 Tax=Chlorella variabilis TaxID=554065 RepID=E1ZA07_CHLVA|nr:hypothetical protein CHLNCDRAFT_142681 [Chlorella variabilis]EFN57336.1 hypothetical protein CHLNCDRAFT_142681 [Chlorella variabilis]|eukprot:XP_005849438.1 hypothetical protein CHLNCDRAFT_142681 [Chlorella variabilis]